MTATNNLDRDVAIATAPGWRPEAGDKLIGKPLGTRLVEGGEYGDYRALILDTADGPIAFHAFHTLAKQALNDNAAGIAAAVKDGKTEVTIVYLGEKVTNATAKLAAKDQTSYHNYFVVVGAPKPVEQKFEF